MRYVVEFAIYLENEFRLFDTSLEKYEFGKTARTRFYTEVEEPDEDVLISNVLDMLFLKYSHQVVKRRPVQAGDVFCIVIDGKDHGIWLRHEAGGWINRHHKWLWGLLRDEKRVA